MSELVSVAGCSSVFMEGLCAYSNKAKITRLGVPANLLQNHGAVSAEVAAAMAERAAKVADTSVGLSTTGIAGPDGGSAEKPVGLVYIGLCINDKVESEKFNITGSRNEVRVRAANLAMDMLRRKLERVNH